MHVFDCETGMQVVAPMEEMECDTLATSGQKIIMRCGGEAILIFRLEEGAEELEDLGMIELTNESESKPVNFMMRGGNMKATLADEKEYEVVLIATQSEEGLTIKLLTSETH